MGSFSMGVKIARLVTRCGCSRQIVMDIPLPDFVEFPTEPRVPFRNGYGLRVSLEGIEKRRKFLKRQEGFAEALYEEE